MAPMSPPVVANASPFSADDCAKHFVDKVHGKDQGKY